MVISVSNRVYPLRYTQSVINFTSKKEEDNSQRVPIKGVTNTLKAVPVAVLLAMSPLNANAQSQTTSTKTWNYQTTEEVNSSGVDRALKGKVVQSLIYKGATPKGGNCNIDLISTDGDDESIEEVLLSFSRTKDDFSFITPEGKLIPAKKEVIEFFKPDTISMMYYTRGGALTSIDKTYYVMGSGYTFYKEIYDRNTGELLSDKYVGRESQKLNYRYHITPEFYDFLNQLFDKDEIVRDTEEYKLLDF